MNTRSVGKSSYSFDNQISPYKSNTLYSGNSGNSQIPPIPSIPKVIISENASKIILAISYHDLDIVKKLINQYNSNDIIIGEEKLTALHYAVQCKKNISIIEYLMSVGANPRLKQIEGKDAIDLAIQSNYRVFIDKIINSRERELDDIYAKFDNVNYEYKDLKRKYTDKTEENNYLLRCNESYVNKINDLGSENKILKNKFNDAEKEINTLKIENTSIKRRCEEVETANINLIKKTRKI